MKKDCENCKHYSDISCTKADGIVFCREETWRSWKPITVKIKYEIVKPFSIIDIYEKTPCSGEFSTLLKQSGDRCIDSKWNRFKSIQKSPVLIRNLPWLETHGFIKKVKNINYRIWTDTSYCKDMNLNKPVDYVFPEKGENLSGWNTKVELLDTDLRIPSGRKDKEFKYFDSIVMIIGTEDKFFTFSKFLKIATTLE